MEFTRQNTTVRMAAFRYEFNTVEELMSSVRRLVSGSFRFQVIMSFVHSDDQIYFEVLPRPTGPSELRVFDNSSGHPPVETPHYDGPIDKQELLRVIESTATEVLVSQEPEEDGDLDDIAIFQIFVSPRSKQFNPSPV
jgi:hypothetical protein